jgi:hypothetical protein
MQIKPGSTCWQIDSDRLSGPLSDGDWLKLLSHRLIDIAAAHPGDQLYGATWFGPSVDFGSPSFSIWFALQGPKMLRDQVDAALHKLLPRQSIKNDITDVSQLGWKAELYIDQGQVWRPLDAVTWECVQSSKSKTQNKEEPLAVARSEATDQQPDSPNPLPPVKRIRLS